MEVWDLGPIADRSPFANFCPAGAFRVGTKRVSFPDRRHPFQFTVKKSDGNSLIEAVIDGFVAVVLFFGLATLIALAAAAVSAIAHVAGLSHELSVTGSLLATSGILLLSTIWAVLVSIAIQHFSFD